MQGISSTLILITSIHKQSLATHMAVELPFHSTSEHSARSPHREGRDVKHRSDNDFEPERKESDCNLIFDWRSQPEKWHHDPILEC